MITGFTNHHLTRFQEDGAKETNVSARSFTTTGSPHANASEKPVLYEMTVRYFGSQPLAYDDECEATYGWRTGFDRSSFVQASVGSGVFHRKTFHGLCGCARSLRQIS